MPSILVILLLSTLITNYHQISGGATYRNSSSGILIDHDETSPVTCSEINAQFLTLGESIGSLCKCYSGMPDLDFDYLQNAYNHFPNFQQAAPKRLGAKSQMWIGCTGLSDPVSKLHSLELNALNSLMMTLNRPEWQGKIWLSKIWIWSCFISRLSNTIFSTFKTDKIILERCKMNYVKNMPTVLEPLASILRHVIFRNNMIKNLTEGMFANLSNVRTIDLSYNQLTDITVNILDDESVSSLRYLSFQNNTISKITGQPFKSMGNLQYLNLADNRLTGFSDREMDVFQGLSNVQVLHLENNQLTTISSKFFDYFPNLHVLNLADNRLHNFGPFPLSLNVKLTQLYMSNNLLSNLPSLNAPDLQVLDFNENLLQELKPDQLGSMPNLKVLSLMSNQLQTWDFPPNTMQKLQVLSLQNNSIQSLPRNLGQKVPRLSKLHLAWNKIDTLTRETFRGLDRMTVLNLARNNLSATLTGDIFETMPMLNRLYINGNRMNRISIAFLKSLPNDTFFNIAENPLDCTCDSLDLYAWLVENFNRCVNIEGVICSQLDPSLLKNKQALTMRKFISDPSFVRMCPAQWEALGAKWDLMGNSNDRLRDQGPSLVRHVDPEQGPSMLATCLALVLASSTLLVLVAIACLFYRDGQYKNKLSGSGTSFESELNRLGWSGEPARPVGYWMLVLSFLSFSNKHNTPNKSPAKLLVADLTRVMTSRRQQPNEEGGDEDPPSLPLIEDEENGGEEPTRV